MVVAAAVVVEGVLKRPLRLLMLETLARLLLLALDRVSEGLFSSGIGGLLRRRVVILSR